MSFIINWMDTNVSIQTFLVIVTIISVSIIVIPLARRDLQRDYDFNSFGEQYLECKGGSVAPQSVVTDTPTKPISTTPTPLTEPNHSEQGSESLKDKVVYSTKYYVKYPSDEVIEVKEVNPETLALLKNKFNQKY